MEGDAIVGEVAAAETAATIETAIDAANEQVEVAEATAAAIAEGALESERGQRIVQLETDLRECRESLKTLEERLAAMPAQTDALLTETVQALASVNADALANLNQRLDTIANPPTLSIPPASEELPVATETQVVTPNAPATESATVTVKEEAEKPKRRHRFL